jgi:hypothetical protein
MSKIKIFEDNFTPLIVKVKTVEGEEFEITSRFMTARELSDVELIGYEKIEPKSKEVWKRTENGKVCKMMTRYFGKDIVFWEQFSLNLLHSLIDYVNEESKKNLK